MAARKTDPQSGPYSKRKCTVEISGLYVRTTGGEGKQSIEVLVEIDGEMRLVQTHFIGDVGGEISHHTSALGLSRKITQLRVESISMLCAIKP